MSAGRFRAAGFGAIGSRGGLSGFHAVRERHRSKRIMLSAADPGIFPCAGIACMLANACGAVPRFGSGAGFATSIRPDLLFGIPSRIWTVCAELTVRAAMAVEGSCARAEISARLFRPDPSLGMPSGIRSVRAVRAVVGTGVCVEISTRLFRPYPSLGMPSGIRSVRAVRAVVGTSVCVEISARLFRPYPSLGMPSGIRSVRAVRAVEGTSVRVEMSARILRTESCVAVMGPGRHCRRHAELERGPRNRMMLFAVGFCSVSRIEFAGLLPNLGNGVPLLVGYGVRDGNSGRRVDP